MAPECIVTVYILRLLALQVIYHKGLLLIAEVRFSRPRSHLSIKSYSFFAAGSDGSEVGASAKTRSRVKGGELWGGNKNGEVLWKRKHKRTDTHI